MPYSRWSRVMLAVTAAGVVSATLYVSPWGPDAIRIPSAVAGQAGGRDESPAFARHRGRLQETIPGVGGESGDGRMAYEDEQYQNLAYPDTEIPVERFEAARQAFDAVKGRGIGRAKSGTWISLGPTSAVYQQTKYRFSYVPSQYEASGRVTAMAIASTCRPGACRMWVAAAGGGVWRTNDALAGSPQWTFLTSGLGLSAVGSIQLDPNDTTGNTIWLGTGEANASADSAAGVGLYKSTDGGDTWTGPLGGSIFAGRAIGSIAVAPASGALYVASARGVRGVTSVNGGATSNQPGAQPYGLWKSIDGGATFTFIHNGTASAAQCYPVIATACSVRGVRRVALDPSDPNTVYAGSYGRGVWRSSDGGATWTQIKASLDSANSSMRPEIAVAALPDGKTRMYVGEGASGSPYARLYRSDDVASGAPVFADLTSSSSADPGFGSYNYCTGQCWYDNLVVTPVGYPDIVYVGGSYQYGEPGRISNGRAVVLSTDAGVSFTDMTMDATDNFYPNGLHPDHHALVVNPGNPFQFFNGSDGGVMRSNGEFADASGSCGWRTLSATDRARCQQLLSRVPKRLEAMNRGLATLQFQSLSVDPNNPNQVQGGTQDNGTFQTSASTAVWKQSFWGDGGQSGFDAADGSFRFHTFYDATPEVNFTNGAIHDWNWMADQIYYGGEPRSFYIPIIADPRESGWMFAGLGHVWRTKTHGRGSRSVQDFRNVCNEFTGSFNDFCGDWEPMGATSYAALPFPYLPSPSSYSATRLTANGVLYGTDRSGGFVAAVERVASESQTLWAATSTGRVFISKNADADPASAVTFKRLDSLASNDPNRFVSGIYVDPANPNRAWISYGGFSATTPSTPGHVFEVVYDPIGGTAAWTNLDGSGLTAFGDQPANDVVRDDATGDLYVSTDFGVVRQPAASSDWYDAAPGLPKVGVPGLTIHAGARRLYAATHGLGAWMLALQ